MKKSANGDDKVWWIEDYETNWIHLWVDADDDIYGKCGASFEIHGIAHTRWDMEPDKVRELSSPEFGYPCPECTYDEIMPWESES